MTFSEATAVGLLCAFGWALERASYWKWRYEKMRDMNDDLVKGRRRGPRRKESDEHELVRP